MHSPQNDRKPDFAATQEFRYQMLSELAADFAYIFSVGADGTLAAEWYNKVFTRTTGYSFEEVMQRGWQTVIHPDDIAVVQKRMQTLLAGRPDVSEFRLVTKEGDVRWFRGYAKAEWSEREQRVTRIFGAAQDITEQKVAEAALRQSEERYRKMVRAVTAYTYSVQIEKGRPVRTVHSIGCLPVTGYRPEDYDQNPMLWYEMIHEADRAKVRAQADQIVNGISVAPLEHRIVRRDGRVVWVKNTVVPHYDTDGRLMRYDGLVEDITERKRAEEALQKSEERYRRLVSAVTAYTYSVDVEQGRAVSTTHSAGCISVTGYTAAEYDDDPLLWYVMIYPDDRGKVRSSAQQVLAGQKVPAFEHRISRRDGQVIWVRNTMVPHFDIDGRLVRYDGLIEDISERKKIEQEREELIGRLQDALAKVKALKRLLPICAACKKIRDDQGYWQQIEAYMHEHADVDFSHGICPDCARKLYPELYEKKDQEKK